MSSSSRSEIDELIYAPPWREWIGDELRGWEIISQWREYGPRDTVDFAKRMADYQSSIYGGGLWDPAQEIACGRRRIVRRVDRVGEYVRAHSDFVAPRELECYLLIFEEGLSLKETASTMGVGISSVRAWIKRLERKARRA